MRQRAFPGRAGQTHGELAADAGVDARVGHEALLAREVEESAVRDARLLRARARVRGPGVEVRVEVDDGHGPVDLVERAQDWQHNRVVASQTGIQVTCQLNASSHI